MAPGHEAHRGPERVLRAAADLLHWIDTALFVVDAGCGLLFVNRRGEALLRDGDGVRSRDGRLQATEPATSRILQAGVESILEPRTGRTPPAVDELVLPRRSGGAPLHAALRALEGGEGAASARPLAAALLVAEPDRPPGLSEARLRRIHGLTRAESRLAARLARGQCLDDAARALGITKQTARKQLQNVFAKAVVHHQGQLVARLLSGVSPGAQP